MSGKPTKAQRLEAKKQKQQEARTAKEKKASDDAKKAPKTKEELKEDLKGLEKELNALYSEVDKFVHLHTVGADNVVWREGSESFVGHNSSWLNAQVRPKYVRARILRGKIEYTKDLIDPSRVARRKKAEEERKKTLDKCILAERMEKAQESFLWKEEGFQEGKWYIERIAAGMIAMREENGDLCGVRCYHQRPDRSYDSCDCKREGNKFTLSPEMQERRANNELVVNNSKWMAQEAMLTVIENDGGRMYHNNMGGFRLDLEQKEDAFNAAQWQMEDRARAAPEQKRDAAS